MFLLVEKNLTLSLSIFEKIIPLKQATGNKLKAFRLVPNW